MTSSAKAGRKKVWIGWIDQEEKLSHLFKWDIRGDGIYEDTLETRSFFGFIFRERFKGRKKIRITVEAL